MNEVVMKVEGRLSDVLQIVQTVAGTAEEVYYDGDRQAWVVRPKPFAQMLEEIGVEVVGVEA